MVKKKRSADACVFIFGGCAPCSICASWKRRMSSPVEPRAERTDQRVRQRSTHRVRDFVFARFAERPVFARPNLWCMIFIDRERHGVIEQTEARSWAAKMSPNGISAAMHAAIEPRRAGGE